jgi:chemotaxis protein MotB
MAKDAAVAPIIIKRVKKRGHAHHGGSWKVAFADFATAMMAFFLLMWLMGATDEKQKGAISEYFNNPSAIAGASTVPSPSSIQGPGGSSTSIPRRLRRTNHPRPARKPTSRLKTLPSWQKS